MGKLIKTKLERQYLGGLLRKFTKNNIMMNVRRNQRCHTI